MYNPMQLTERTILLTGASSGIGQATAVLLSKLGARLILVGRKADTLLQTQSLLQGSGHHIACFDLLDIDNIPEWMRKLAETHGPFHGLVHSAGQHVARPLKMLNSAVMTSAMQLNVFAAMALAKGLRQKGVMANSASIVWLSSVAALVGQPGVSPYAASKGALLAMCKSLALELAKEQIRINCVVPAMVQTPMAEKLFAMMTPEQVAKIELAHPLGIGQPEDVANAIAFLLSDAAKWITGSSLVVDGGYTAQ